MALNILREARDVIVDVFGGTGFHQRKI